MTGYAFGRFDRWFIVMTTTALRLVGAGLLATGLVVSPAWAAAIGDFVWDDADGDGSQEAGEAGFAGVAVSLEDCGGASLAATQTDAAGKYLFSGLAAGNYRVRFAAPAGFGFSAPRQTTGGKDSNADPATGLTGCVSMGTNQTRRGIDAGLIRSAGSAAIGDFVWNDANGDGIQESGEAGLAGVAVTLEDCGGASLAATQTDAAGKYLFSGLAAGNYRVRFAAPAGFGFSAPRQTTGGKDSNADPATGLTGCVSMGTNQTRRGIDAGLTPSSGDPPNILFVLADDLGAEASRLYPALAGDSGQVATPNLEALAAAGIVFDNAWANPVCTPTRGTLISGEYGHRTDVTNNGDVLDPATTTSIFEYLTSGSPANYAMAVFGKWHLGDNVRAHGVPVFKGFLGGLINDYFNWTYEDVDGNPTNTTTYATTALTDFTIEFIQNHRQTNPSDPWFVFLSYNAPHSVQPLPNIGFQVPPDELHSVNLGNLQPGDIATSVPVYQAMIQAMDTEIGRLLDAIGAPGTPERDNTIVIFMGDNGTPRAVKDSNTGLRGAKANVQEGGVRVPLVVSGAGVTRRNAREDAVIVAADLYATIAELSGIAVSQIHDSWSFVPLLTGAGAVNGREYGFAERCNNRTRYTIRDARYKLTFDNGTWEMYDLVDDLLETSNLYNDPGFAVPQSVLEAELNALKQSATSGCFQ